MVQPSQRWLDKFNETLVPETFVKITYAITEPGLQEDAIPSTNGEVSFSDVSSVVKNESLGYTKYATGELNFVPLDGTFQIPFANVPESTLYTLTTPEYDALTTSDNDVLLCNLFIYPEEAGYVSEFCVSDSYHPKITLSFSKLHTAKIPGVTITWSQTCNEWATSFKLTAYSGKAVVSTKTIPFCLK